MLLAPCALHVSPRAEFPFLGEQFTDDKQPPNMSYIMVDIESDGPIPGDFSMICFGAVVVEPTLSKTFHGQLHPISDHWIPEALAVSGFTREQVLEFPDAKSVMGQFLSWLCEHSSGRPMFI